MRRNRLSVRRPRASRCPRGPRSRANEWPQRSASCRSTLERGQVAHVAELGQRLWRVSCGQALGHHRAPVERHPGVGAGDQSGGRVGPARTATLTRAPARRPQLRVKQAPGRGLASGRFPAWSADSPGLHTLAEPPVSLTLARQLLLLLPAFLHLLFPHSATSGSPTHFFFFFCGQRFTD